MSNVTTRIPVQINERLNNISEYTGIPKSALILYAINDCIRLSREYQHNNDPYLFGEPVRFTLRMPEHIKNELTVIAEKNNTSVNALIVFYIEIFDTLFWYHYR